MRRRAERALRDAPAPDIAGRLMWLALVPGAGSAVVALAILASLLWSR